MKVLVLGGTGLLSGPVARALISEGADVTILHRGTRAPPNGASEIRVDRFQHEQFLPAVRSTGPWDVVLDMNGGTREHAGSVIETVSGMTAHVIFCSTTTVYGRPFDHVPVVETRAGLEPPSPYGQGKLDAEKTYRAAEKRGLCSVTIIRPAHLYGWGCAPLHSLGNRTSHLDRMRTNRPVILHDDGNGLWSSLWVDDAATAFAGAAIHPAAKGQSYHIAGEETFTWNAYNSWQAEALAAPAPNVLYIPAITLAKLAPERSIQCIRTLQYPGVYDCTKARAELAFKTRIRAGEGWKQVVSRLARDQAIESWKLDPEYEQLTATTPLPKSQPERNLSLILETECQPFFHDTLMSSSVYFRRMS